MSPTLARRDILGTIKVRIGIGRNSYKVIPGLYCIGTPTKDSPVLVTANYKLSFDHLRKNLQGFDLWILVVDTRGINVWCAAGKKTFSTEEVAIQVKRTGLGGIVTHRTLILPQLAATGVAAHTLKKLCGFSGRFGPASAKDLPRYLTNSMVADEKMRTITFSIGERLVLIPVEITLIWKFFFIIIALSFALSGIGPNLFSLSHALQRGWTLTLATIIAVGAGAILVPLFLQWFPGRQFWIKGVVAGFFGWLLLCLSAPHLNAIALISLLTWICAVSSYMAMNFTGATPFTSLSGVKYEMKRGLAFQGIASAVALLLWLVEPFSG